jgi:hypothetical protein
MESGPLSDDWLPAAVPGISSHALYVSWTACWAEDKWDPDRHTQCQHAMQTEIGLCEDHYSEIVRRWRR